MYSVSLTFHWLVDNVPGDLLLDCLMPKNKSMLLTTVDSLWTFACIQTYWYLFFCIIVNSDAFFVR